MTIINKYTTIKKHYLCDFFLIVWPLPVYLKCTDLRKD